ncbi:MAG: ankyrin repeat domain-containing protein, partial [Acidilobus sp.]
MGSDVDALFEAIDRGDVEEVRRLLKVLGPNARDRDGTTPLHEAALNGLANVVKLLLDSGADPNARDRHRVTPLH